MATHTSFVRKSGVDGGTIRLNAKGQLAAGGIMEPFSAGTLGGAPSVFYVDGNVVSSGNGLSWLSAVKTLAEGLALAQAYQSTSGNRAWAHRSTVYVCGDALVEDIVLAAEKTDVIGVGSSNSHDMVEITGNHVPATNNTWGMRWYHCHFQEVDTGAIWTLQAQESGWKFIDCVFSARSVNTTHGILWTAAYNLEVRDCLFDGFPNAFTTGAIVIGAGTSDRVLIHDNQIYGRLPIVIDASFTEVAGILHIDNNVIIGFNKVITDASNLAVVTRNRMITTNISEGTPGDMWDGASARWADNQITGSGGTADQVPYVSES